MIDPVARLCGTRTLKVSASWWLMRRRYRRVCFAWCATARSLSLLPGAGYVGSTPSSQSGRVPRGPQPEAARCAGSGGARAVAIADRPLCENAGAGGSPPGSGPRRASSCFGTRLWRGLDIGCPRPHGVLKVSSLHRCPVPPIADFSG